ncbi:MAG: hypothetical protein MRZ79_03600 [Bacteroidia bacterium]|nr:hypothetical protein [Bacteroidia bacterium]
MRIGVGTKPLKFLVVFIFLALNHFQVNSQVLKILERFEDYDLLTYDLELQISSEKNRIAGTQKITFQPERNTRTIWLDMGPELRIAEISWNQHKLGYDYLGEALRIDFPEMLQKDKVEEIQIIYHGNLRGLSPYPVWQRNEFNRLQIGLGASHLPAYFWWPCKEHGDDPANHMRISVILPEEVSLFCTGKQLSSIPLAGQFVKNTFFLEGPLLPEELSLYVGEFESIKDSHNSNGKSFEMTYFVQPDKKTQAFSHLAQVKRIFNTLENYFGEYPRISTGYSWFQPLDIGPSEYLYKNNPWGFDPFLLRDIARQYTTYVPHNSDSLGRRIYEAFPYYVEYLMVENWFDKASASRFLTQGNAPIYHTVSLLEAIRKQAPSEDLWFSKLIGFLQQEKDGKFSIDYFKSELNSESATRMNQLFALKQKPVLQYHLSGKKRKLKCYYRWKGAESDFSYPIYLITGSEKQRIIPNANWQSLTFKGISPKNIKPEDSQIWYEVKEEDFLKD